MRDNEERDKKCLLIVVNDAAFFLSHRLPVALAAKRAGYNVHVATPYANCVEKIKDVGLRHHIITFNRSGINPILEFKVIISLYRLFKKIEINVLHLVTIKPVIYGGIAARLANIPAVTAAISGLGHVFSVESRRNILLRKLVLMLYRQAFVHPNLRVIFQNPNDRDAMLKLELLASTQAVMIRGSGVDLNIFKPRDKSNSPPIVLMASRLIKNKGVGEFVDAARILKNLNLAARFILVGEPDFDNPQSLSISEFNTINEEDIVECWGFRSDMARVLSTADIIILPSYYGEGLPKILIEAAACGRAVVTTDIPGCRDAIIDNVTGLLVPPRDSNALAIAIKKLILNTEQRENMGRSGRQLAENTFSIKSVVEAHLEVYKELIENSEISSI